MKCVDTTFLIDLLHNDAGAVAKAEELDRSGGAFTTEVNIFEVVFGIYRVKNLNHKKRLEQVERLFSRLHIFPLGHEAAIRSGEILGRLAREGMEIDVPDGMTAAITLVNGYNTIVTRNVDHFERIPRIKVETY